MTSIITAVLLIGFQTKSPAPVAFVHVNVIPMDREVVLADQTVIVSGNRIIAIGPTSKITVPQKALLINGKGKYLIPGLIDMNVQLTAAEELPLYLASGVTTVYNLNGQPAHLRWRNMVNRGELKGPTIITCGPKVFRLHNAQAAVKFVEDQVHAGYDAIFVHDAISAAIFPTIVSSSRKNGILLVGQIPGGVGLDGVLSAKMPICSIEQLFTTKLRLAPNMSTAINTAAMATARSRVPVFSALIDTIHAVRQAEDLKSFLSRTDTRYLSPWQRTSWQAGENDIQKRLGSREFHPAILSSMENQRDFIRSFHRAGGILLVGTNSNNTGVVPGVSTIEEMQNLPRLGFTNFQVMRAATIDAAATLRRNAIGSISVGKQADFVLLNGNPLSDLANLSNRSGVMVRGNWMTSQVLQKEVNAIPSHYDALLARGQKVVHANPGAFLAFESDNDPRGLMTNYLLLELVKANGEGGIVDFVKRSAKEPQNPLTTENGINTFGYWVLTTKNHPLMAIKVFIANTQLHPMSANMFDSLGEAYAKARNKPKAIESYRKAVKLDPGFSSSVQALKILTGK